MKININTGAHVSPQRLNAVLEGLVRLAQVDLRNNLELPALYESGVRYRRESPDQWQTPTESFTAGFADCEDLSAWRAAELRQAGVEAKAVAYRSGPRTWHVVVQYPDGKREDPSKRLGMGRES